MTTTSRIAFTLSFASLVAACSGHDPKSTSSSIGAPIDDDGNDGPGHT